MHRIDTYQFLSNRLFVFGFRVQMSYHTNVNASLSEDGAESQAPVEQPQLLQLPQLLQQMPLPQQPPLPAQLPQQPSLPALLPLQPQLPQSIPQQPAAPVDLFTILNHQNQIFQLLANALVAQGNNGAPKLRPPAPQANLRTADFNRLNPA